MVIDTFDSHIDFIKKFQNDSDCLSYLLNIRWPNGIACPFCGNKSYYTTNRGYRCKNKNCVKKFTPFIKTIFENTKAPLHIWFYLIYSMAINKKNISSIQNSKNIGITQSMTWGMMRKIRSALKEKVIIKLSGIVEVDEAFCSKGNMWTRWGGITTRKAPILGLTERGGKAVIRMIEDRTKASVIKIIREHVVDGSTIFTDGYAGYRGLTKWYTHDWVEHGTREYVRDDVHTNTIENVWSQLKKSIRNAHHSVSNTHLEGYCNEICFRLNYRDLSFPEMFDEILFRCVNTINV